MLIPNTWETLGMESTSKTSLSDTSFRQTEHSSYMVANSRRTKLRKGTHYVCADENKELRFKKTSVYI